MRKASSLSDRDAMHDIRVSVYRLKGVGNRMVGSPCSRAMTMTISTGDRAWFFSDLYFSLIAACKRENRQDDGGGGLWEAVFGELRSMPGRTGPERCRPSPTRASHMTAHISC